ASLDINRDLCTFLSILVEGFIIKSDTQERHVGLVTGVNEGIRLGNDGLDTSTKESTGSLLTRRSRTETTASNNNVVTFLSQLSELGLDKLESVGTQVHVRSTGHELSGDNGIRVDVILKALDTTLD